MQGFVCEFMPRNWTIAAEIACPPGDPGRAPLTPKCDA